MSDISLSGIYSVMFFGVLAATGLVVLAVALLVSMLQKIRNKKPLKSQPGFGYVIGSSIPVIAGVLFMYIVAAVDDDNFRLFFDSYGTFIVMVIAYACMIYIGRRWKRNHQ